MTSMPDLAGRTALVTGASRGIGLAIAERLLACGAEVWLNGRDEAALVAECARLAPLYPGRAHPLVFDVADPQAVKTGFGAIQKTSRRLDILVNNAAIMRGAVIEMASVELIDATLTTNLRGVLMCAQYGARLMARSGGGAIINITSIIGRVGSAGQSVYGASKAGVIGATLGLAKELAGRQIRVNAIAPGIIETDLIAELPPAKREATVAAIGLGRIGTPADVAALALFLASDEAAYITGQVIGVDGGLVM
jgi:3-oxoacyl-[acyl-carrier protein] reductase